MNENKNALLNAGFTGNIETSLFLNTGGVVVYVDYKTLVMEIYLKPHHDKPYKEKTAKDLKDVSDTCYGYLDRYLDFSDKPKYDWETVFEKLSTFENNLWLDAITSLHSLCKSRLLMNGEEFDSIVAKMKLQLIIKQIDKDFPRETHIEYENNIGIVKLDEEGSLKTYLSDRRHAFLSNFTIITASFEGAEQLLKSNPELLNQLFKIKSDA